MNYTITTNHLENFYKCPWLLTKLRDFVPKPKDDIVAKCILDLFTYNLINEEWISYKNIKTKWERTIVEAFPNATLTQ